MPSSTTLPAFKLGGTSILRNDGLDPLSDQQLKRFSPTIFTKSGIYGVENVRDVSDKYGHVSTIEIINAMRDIGYMPVEVRQSMRKDADRMPFTKHMVKFRRDGALKKVMVGDVVPQLTMLNSHDRSSGFHLYMALFRLLCGNGLMVSEGADVEPVRVPHTLRMVENIVEQSQLLVKGMSGVYELRDQMLATPMTAKQQTNFAVAALEFRPPRRTGVLEPSTLLTPRRAVDDKPDLWHVFNRVQENMMRGGNETKTADGRMATTRGIGRIERDVEVNRALWSLAVQTIAKASTSAKKTVAAKKRRVVTEDDDV